MKSEKIKKQDKLNNSRFRYDNPNLCPYQNIKEKMCYARV